MSFNFENEKIIDWCGIVQKLRKLDSEVNEIKRMSVFVLQNVTEKFK